MSRSMNRLCMIVAGLALVGASGCCHPCSSRSSCVDWDDGCHVDSWRHGSQRHGRRGRNCDDCGCDSCCESDCCNSCCGSGNQPTGHGQSYNSPLPGSHETGMPMTGGCASGDCGLTAPSYGGIPIDPSGGWTIQSMPTSTTTSEPVPAPPSNGNLQPIPAAPSAGASSAPAPVPPPVSFAR
jgi:hypothetical protein